MLIYGEHVEDSSELPVAFCWALNRVLQVGGTDPERLMVTYPSKCNRQTLQRYDGFLGELKPAGNALLAQNWI